MSSIGANYAQLQVMQKKQKDKMMKKRLEMEKDCGIDGGERERVSSSATGKSGNRIFPVKSSQSTTYEEEVGKHQQV
ncbi:uncharacterized protein LOC108810685 [Raphanus sativus]|uniref:Uncharacterized protein LOC108810685 n=1 Tax=Raphanus sativus TaxID=3726 RepID=A0A6J0JRV0_RAPSA|nr:uncharacterized protein LOC108810685 [Raphanus sativus]